MAAVRACQNAKETDAKSGGGQSSQQDPRRRKTIVQVLSLKAKGEKEHWGSGHVKDISRRLARTQSNIARRSNSNDVRDSDDPGGHPGKQQHVNGAAAMIDDKGGKNVEEDDRVVSLHEDGAAKVSGWAAAKTASSADSEIKTVSKDAGKSVNDVNNSGGGKTKVLNDAKEVAGTTSKTLDDLHPVLPGNKGNGIVTDFEHGTTQSFESLLDEISTLSDFSGKTAPVEHRSKAKDCKTKEVSSSSTKMKRPPPVAPKKNSGMDVLQSEFSLPSTLPSDVRPESKTSKVGRPDERSGTVAKKAESLGEKSDSLGELTGAIAGPLACSKEEVSMPVASPRNGKGCNFSLKASPSDLRRPNSEVFWRPSPFEVAAYNENSSLPPPKPWAEKELASPPADKKAGIHHVQRPVFKLGASSLPGQNRVTKSAHVGHMSESSLSSGDTADSVCNRTMSSVCSSDNDQQKPTAGTAPSNKDEARLSGSSPISPGCQSKEARKGTKGKRDKKKDPGKGRGEQRNSDSSTNSPSCQNKTAGKDRKGGRQRDEKMESEKAGGEKCNREQDKKEDNDKVRVTEEEEEEAEGEEEEELACYNHAHCVPRRYCNDHDQAVCLECAFELHRTCRDVEVLEAAAEGRRVELGQMNEVILSLRADWESSLQHLDTVRTKLGSDKTQTLAFVQTIMDETIQMIKSKEKELVEEVESLYAKEREESDSHSERMRRALDTLGEVQGQVETLLSSGQQARLLRQFGKLKGRCEAVMEMDPSDIEEVVDDVRLTDTWLDILKQLTPARLTVTRRPAVPRKHKQLADRGLDTFRRISKRRRRGQSLDASLRDGPVIPPVRHSTPQIQQPYLGVAHSVTSAGSILSAPSSHSINFLDGPQQMFEVFAGLESDRYLFGLGDICVMQPRLTILVTYLTSDQLRVFPWRGEAEPFTSDPLGCTLCCITQLTNETVAVTSSNSDQLSILKVSASSIKLTHAASMKRQYRAVTSLDYRTVALATDSKKASNNVIVIVRFDSSDYRSFTHLKTITARNGSVPLLRYFSKTVFKVPYSMCVNSSGHIVVSDSESKAMTALDQDGNKRWAFQPPRQTRVLDTPGGVACSPSGYLYLVDSCEQRILRFDRSGKLRKVVLSLEDGLEWPVGVACADDSTLCVAEFYGQVKVFRIR